MTTQNKLLAEIEFHKMRMITAPWSKSELRLDQCKKDIALFKEKIREMGGTAITKTKEGQLDVLVELDKWLDEAGNA